MEEKALVVDQAKPLTAKELQAQVNLIQQVMQQVMKEGSHYGKIPGCGSKPTLLKPGAEKIMATFRLSADPVIEDLSAEDEIRYRVTVRLTSAIGTFVGAGIGECSSSEDKYKWRKVVCDEEFEETPDDRRREKWIKPYQQRAFKVKQVRTSPSDLANTILKMAKKRALVDATLTATAASDIFEQDIEDLPEEFINQEPNGKESVGMPEEKSNVQTNAFKQMIKQFEFAKNKIGDEDYYHILKKHGFKHANEIKSIKKGNELLVQMKSLIDALGGE